MSNTSETRATLTPEEFIAQFAAIQSNVSHTQLAFFKQAAIDIVATQAAARTAALRQDLQGACEKQMTRITEFRDTLDCMYLGEWPSSQEHVDFIKAAGIELGRIEQMSRMATKLEEAMEKIKDLADTLDDEE